MSEAPAAIGEKRAVEKADLFRLKFITDAQLSPDGKRVAYTISHVDIEKEKEFSAIWLLTLESGAARQLTAGTAKDGAPQWSPDGKQIAFLSSRDEKPQIYVMPVDGGEARKVTSFKQGVASSAAWSPDGKHIAFTAVPIEEPRDPMKPYRLDRNVYRFNEMEYLDDVVQSLYVIDAAGGEARRLTNDRYMNTTPQWSPDGKEILFSASMGVDNYRGLFPRLCIVDMTSGTIRELAQEWGIVGAAAWARDGKRIVFTGQVNGLPIGSKSDVWVIDREGGTPQPRSASFETGVGGGLQADMPVVLYSPTLKVSKDGKFVYVPAQIGGNVNIAKVALDGDQNVQILVSGERTCALYSAGDQHLIYAASDLNHPPQLYLSNLDGSKEKQLTHINDEWLSQVALPGIEHLLFPGSDGVQVEGWLVTPAEGVAPYPTVLYIHGGPHGAFGNVFHFDTQMLAGAGYAVLLVNHRASTGYGDAFSTAIKGDWGNLDYKDLMAGVDYVIDKGWADADRLGVCGLSGGGNLTTWIIGNTTRFKAAVPENPVTNWVSFYGVSDIGVWFGVEEMGGHPQDIPEVYTRCSPITYAHNCITPTLMVQGENDWRCPPEQTEQFYTRLKVAGCTVEMLRLPNSAHGATITGNVPVRSAHNDALLDWMNRYVLGKME
jgi:dipeptidyl aminopeptidase/acylaminoacyl peptidase